MRKTKEDNTLLASLAVFREIYNAQKDVYGIISVFLTELIRNQALYSFSLNEITSKLNSTYEFEIPDAVVRTSLGRLTFLKKEKTNYEVSDMSNIKGQSVSETQKAILSSNQSIIDNLIRFTEKEKKEQLTDTQKEKVSHSFCCFLLDQNNGDEYIEYITAFILENEGDTEFKNQLNLIREGVILYSGIKYNNNLNDLGTWRTELTIYVDTEILFHLAGYNGELYKNLVFDFLNFVKEINIKATRKLIKLKYFTEVRYQIEGFFTKAKYLVEGNVSPDPTTTAMVSIVNGCKSPSYVIEKKSDFYVLLKSLGFEEDTYDEYYSDYNNKYNVISQEIDKRVSEEIGEDAGQYLKFLNYISIHRGEANENNFENIGDIFLTGNSTTLKVAWHDLLKDDGNVPLATHLGFLTSKFWFKLNKGFGKNHVPKSFDIITKAQVVLSKVLQDKVGTKFEELKSQYKSGKLTEAQAKGRIIALRHQVRKPEEIKNDIVKDILSVITEDSLEKFIEEQSYLKIKAEKHEEENLKLLDELEAKKGIENQYLEAKRQILSEKTNLRDALERQRKKLEGKAIKKYQNLKIATICLVVLYCVLMVAAIFYYTWDKMEKYTYIFGGIPIAASVIYLILFERSINPIKVFDRQKQKYINDTYKEFEFDISEIEKVEQEIGKLKNELNIIGGNLRNIG